MGARIRLISAHRREFGLNACCRALGVRKSSFYWHTRTSKERQSDREFKEHIRAIVQEHPGYGLRRIRAELVERMGRPVNRKRVRRLVGDLQLKLTRQLPRRRPSGIDRVLESFRGSLNLVKGRQFGPLEALSTDFTEIVYQNGAAKAHLMLYVDISSKLALGWAVGESPNTDLALASWSRAREELQAWGADVRRVVVHSDMDSVFRSYRYLGRLFNDGVRVSFSERGARDNPWIESLWGRVKVELGSALTCSESFDELVRQIDGHMSYYNRQRRHSSLGYQTPAAALEEKLTKVSAGPEGPAEATVQPPTSALELLPSSALSSGQAVPTLPGTCAGASQATGSPESEKSQGVWGTGPPGS
jgi:putative transposase